jgi:hypothetical protein
MPLKEMASEDVAAVPIAPSRVRDAAPRSAGLLTEICASHEGEFFLHVIEHPVAFF